MIYVVTTSREQEALMPDARFQCFKDVFGNNAKLILVNSGTDFGFLDADKDVVIIETRASDIVDKIVATGVRTTYETPDTIRLTFDKEESKALLAAVGVPTPKTVFYGDVVDGGLYFVKPLHGEDSNCVDDASICHNIQEVEAKVSQIEDELGDQALIEEFIDGRDCTVGLIMNYKTGVPDCFPVILSYESKNGILTHELKFAEIDRSTPLREERLMDYARKAFKAVGGQRIMRIDFRMAKNGEFYLIDLNLFPCLGNTDHLAGCAKVCAGIEYDEFLKRIVDTATKRK